ncbi:hypothetical protein TAMA11512_13710 [Selenomonas sp. TAMA-11512]|nr:hypothetical protein TAMA11512_13710 [Selenomonas sp. TAMA-11512]
MTNWRVTQMQFIIHPLERRLQKILVTHEKTDRCTILYSGLSEKYAMLSSTYAFCELSFIALQPS